MRRRYAISGERSPQNVRRSLPHQFYGDRIRPRATAVAPAVRYALHADIGKRRSTPLRGRRRLHRAENGRSPPCSRPPPPISPLPRLPRAPRSPLQPHRASSRFSRRRPPLFAPTTPANDAETVLASWLARRAATTARTYRGHATRFAKWLGMPDMVALVPWLEATARGSVTGRALAYLATMEAPPAPATHNAAVAALQSLVRHLARL
jgi:hypothetical protein